MPEPIREAVVQAMVAWKRADGGPRSDPDGSVWRLVNSATPEELIEAMRRLLRGQA